MRLGAGVHPLAGRPSAQDHSFADHRDIGIPRKRLIAQPTMVRVTAPTISTTISRGVRRKQRLTMGVVVPDGGCDAQEDQHRPGQRHRERPGPRPGERDPLLQDAPAVKEVGKGERAPARIAAVCPMGVLRRLDGEVVGCSKKNSAVGPREGKSRGCPEA